MGKAAERHKNAAHGVSRGWIRTKGVAPGRGERRLSHTSGNILLHLVFGTQERRPLIKPDVRQHLFAYLGRVPQPFALFAKAGGIQVGKKNLNPLLLSRRFFLLPTLAD